MGSVSKKYFFLLLILQLLFACGKNNGVAPGDSASSGSGSGSTQSSYKIFLTALYGGNFGGVAGADSTCMADPAKPADGKNYKAMLGASNRFPPSTDWVFKPNKAYVRVNNTPIATTTAGAVFSFPLTNSLDANILGVWTGFNSSWVVSNNCSDWSISIGSGEFGDSHTTSSSMLKIASGSCGSTNNLICVEQ
jgi:hypothetical protein